MRPFHFRPVQPTTPSADPSSIDSIHSLILSPILQIEHSCIQPRSSKLGLAKRVGYHWCLYNSGMIDVCVHLYMSLQNVCALLFAHCVCIPIGLATLLLSIYVWYFVINWLLLLLWTLTNLYHLTQSPRATFLCSVIELLPKTTYENAAFIHVIPKPGMGHGDCANYRPISRINVDFKLMTKVLANQINTFLARHRYSSSQIGIHRGTRQVCPLSPILFILVLEPLAIKCRCHPDERESLWGFWARVLFLLLSSLDTSLPNLSLVLYIKIEFYSSYII